MAPSRDLSGGAVEVDQPLVDQPLLAGLVADELGADDVQDAVDGLGHALAAVALAAVAQLHRLEGAGGRAAGHGGPGDRPVVEGDLDLDGGVSARVEDLPRAYGIDAGHGGSLASPGPVMAAAAGGGFGVELPGVAADRLPQRVLDVPAALLPRP